MPEECFLTIAKLLSLRRGCAGDGWARRAEDAILHGCLPVIIMDLVEEKFESLLDYGAFSLRVPEAELERVRSLQLENLGMPLNARQHSLQPYSTCPSEFLLMFDLLLLVTCWCVQLEKEARVNQLIAQVMWASADMADSYALRGRLLETNGNFCKCHCSEKTCN